MQDPREQELAPFSPDERRKQVRHEEHEGVQNRDAVEPGHNVLIVDDVLATGGTAAAAAKLVEKLGGNVVGLSFVIELDALKGRDKLPGYDVESLLHY